MSKMELALIKNMISRVCILTCNLLSLPFSLSLSLKELTVLSQRQDSGNLHIRYKLSVPIVVFINNSY